MVKIFKTTVLGVGPFCVEFDDGEIVYCRTDHRARLIAAAPRMLDIIHMFHKKGMGCPVCLGEPCQKTCAGPDARALLKEIE